MTWHPYYQPIDDDQCWQQAQQEQQQREEIEQQHYEDLGQPQPVTAEF